MRRRSNPTFVIKVAEAPPRGALGHQTQTTPDEGRLSAGENCEVLVSLAQERTKTELWFIEIDDLA